MKKTILTLILILTTQPLFAQGIGYIDYSKVVENYSLAKTYKKQIDTVYEDYKKYVVSQEQAVIKAVTKEEKQKIEKVALKEIEKQQKNYISTRNKKEAEVKANIEKAANAVRIEKNLDAIVKKDFMVSGGIDCTKEVLNKLK